MKVVLETRTTLDGYVFICTYFAFVTNVYYDMVKQTIIFTSWRSVKTGVCDQKGHKITDKSQW